MLLNKNIRKQIRCLTKVVCIKPVPHLQGGNSAPADIDLVTIIEELFNISA
jgi:hypothetical protein